jgi:hypothetical protein
LQLTAQFCAPIGDHSGASGGSGGMGLDDGGMGSVNFSNGNLMLKIGQVIAGARCAGFCDVSRAIRRIFWPAPR